MAVSWVVIQLDLGSQLVIHAILSEAGSTSPEFDCGRRCEYSPRVETNVCIQPCAQELESREKTEATKGETDLEFPRLQTLDSEQQEDDLVQRQNAAESKDQPHSNVDDEP